MLLATNRIEKYMDLNEMLRYEMKGELIIYFFRTWSGDIFLNGQKIVTPCENSRNVLSYPVLHETVETSNIKFSKCFMPLLDKVENVSYPH